MGSYVTRCIFISYELHISAIHWSISSDLKTWHNLENSTTYFQRIVSYPKYNNNGLADCEDGDVELNREELAEIVGHKHNSILSERIFELIDTDKNGTICAREPAKLFLLLMKGTAEEKAHLLYSVYDVDSRRNLFYNDRLLSARPFLLLPLPHPIAYSLVFVFSKFVFVS